MSHQTRCLCVLMATLDRCNQKATWQQHQMMFNACSHSRTARKSTSADLAAKSLKLHSNRIHWKCLTRNQVIYMIKHQIFIDNLGSANLFWLNPLPLSSRTLPKPPESPPAIPSTTYITTIKYVHLAQNSLHDWDQQTITYQSTISTNIHISILP